MSNQSFSSNFFQLFPYHCRMVRLSKNIFFFVRKYQFKWWLCYFYRSLPFYSYMWVHLSKISFNTVFMDFLFTSFRNTSTKNNKKRKSPTHSFRFSAQKKMKQISSERRKLIVTLITKKEEIKKSFKATFRLCILMNDEDE